MFDVKQSDKIKFTFYPSRVDYYTNAEAIDIGVKISKEEAINNYPTYESWNSESMIHDIDLLNIVEVYQNAKSEVQRLLVRNKIYSEDYAEMVYKQYGEYFKSVAEVKNLLLNKSNNDMDISNTPLGKLRNDIIRELRGDEN